MIRVLVSLNEGVGKYDNPWLAQVVNDDGDDLNVRISITSRSVEAALAKLATHLAERVEVLGADRTVLREALERLASNEGFKFTGMLDDATPLSRELRARMEYAQEKLEEATQAAKGL